MKMGVEAFSTMYLALFSLYVNEILKDDDINVPNVTNKIKDTAQSLNLKDSNSQVENSTIHEEHTFLF